MSATPDVRVVVGLPLYGGGNHLARALDSLLSQTYRSLACVVVDDAADDAARTLVEARGTAGDPVSYSRNERRLGLVGNWRRAFEVALTEHPCAELFAWGSDHDVWDPHWAERLVAALDAAPEAVLAYPRRVVIDEHGAQIGEAGRPAEVRSEPHRARRLVAATREMSAGNMVYGLVRVEALRGAGVFRRVLLPDRLLLTELAVAGELHQVPEVLWRRRRTHAPTLSRQRDAFFPDGVPLWGRLPWWAMHGPILAWTIALRRGGPRMGRRERLRLAATGLRTPVAYAALRRLRRLARTGSRASGALYWSLARRPRGARLLAGLRRLLGGREREAHLKENPISI